MPKTKYPKVKRGSTLWKIGYWATAWWGVTCLYCLLLVWMGNNELGNLSDYKGFWTDWLAAIKSAYRTSALLTGLLAVIIIVWAIGGYIWMRELGKLKIPYRVALKDLFLTIRK